MSTQACACSPGKSQRLAGGFTIAELVMVVFIIAILSAVATPRYARSIARYRADMAARRIAADLGLAQSRARSQSASQTVNFTMASSQYQIIGMSDPEKPNNAYIVALGDEPYKAAISSASGDVSITFDGYGAPSNGVAIAVTSGDASRTVTINADTGLVSIQ